MSSESATAVTIYHNPSCGTSRNTLALILHAGIEPSIVEYLKTPPTKAELRRLVAATGGSLRALLREKGTPYAELQLGDPRWTDDELLDFIGRHPILLNRPIVVTPLGTKLCRPSEAVLELLPVAKVSPFTKEDGEVVEDTGARRTPAAPCAIRAARADDLPGIEALLEACGLPTQGAADHLQNYVIVEAEGRVVASAGIETYKDRALLRSVAVDPASQGRQLGGMLVARMLNEARAHRVARVHLLTTTAAGYFERLGFSIEDRSAAPSSLSASAEFRGACPASATFMTLVLDGSAGAGIRAATPDDAEAILAIYAPIVTTTAISFEIEPPSIEDMRARIGSTLTALPWLVALDEGGAVAGYAYAGRHRERPAYRWSADTTVYVREDRRGSGVGKALYRTLLVELAALGYHSVFAGIALPNDASVRLHEAIGFRRVGVFREVGCKFGGWRDVGWWQRLTA